MTYVKATILLEIDETDEEKLKANAGNFLAKMIESAPSNAIENNAVRKKPIFSIEEVSE